MALRPDDQAPLSAKGLRLLVSAVPGPCVLLADGVVEAANDEAVALTGIPRRRLVGVPLGELLLPELQTAWTDALAASTSAASRHHTRLSGTLVPLELGLRRINGQVVVVGLRSTASEHHYSALAGAELTHDPATGLANRYHLLALLHQRIVSADRSPLAIVALWIDALGDLTSTQGERVVDRVVREVGGRIQARLRSPDVLGRFDQAGFVGLLTSEAPPEQLIEIAERLRAEVAFPVEVDGCLVSFTASVAVASITGRRPSIERALARLEEVAGRAARGGTTTEILDL